MWKTRSSISVDFNDFVDNMYIDDILGFNDNEKKDKKDLNEVSHVLNENNCKIGLLMHCPVIGFPQLMSALMASS